MWIWIIIGGILIWISSYYLLTQKKGSDKSDREQIQGLQRKVTDDDNRFRARKETKTAIARAEARHATNQEAQEIVEAKVIETAYVQADFDLKEAPDRAEENRALEKSLHDNQKALVEAATPLLLDPVSLVEVSKKEHIDKLEREHQRKLAADQIRMGIVAKMFSDHQRMEELQYLIDQKILEIMELKARKWDGKIIDDWAAEAMIASRKESIQAWEVEKRGIQGLLRGDSRKELTGGDEDTDLR